jgi:radical SAM protein with 4Fe4S-binding SPASM domain
MDENDKDLDPFFELQTSERIRRAAADLRPLVLNLEITNACGGSCAYCLSGSLAENKYFMPKEKAMEVIEDGKKIGIRHVTLPGGDPLLHPDFFEIIEWSGTELGMHSFIVTSSMISKKKAKKIADLAERSCIHMVGIHIDTIDPETYAEIHFKPETLRLKMQGYDNLLEAGFPPSGVVGCMCLTNASVRTAEQTLDWFHERGAAWINLLPFKPYGFGDTNKHLEPRKSDLKRVAEHRAKLKGSEWLRIGTMECSKYFCQTTVFVTYEGYVMPCAFFRETKYGTIFEESLVDIFNRHKEEILYKHEVEGPCGACKNNDICFGCRSNAQTYYGNSLASDPKCWLNPDTPELIFAQDD